MCVPLVAAAAAAAVAGASMSQTGKKISPTPLATPPTPQELKAADLEAIRTANKGTKSGINSGISSTLLTGPAGVVDPLQLGKNKLLGQ